MAARPRSGSAMKTPGVVSAACAAILLFPYLVGVTGIVVIGFTAKRWSRGSDVPSPDTAQAEAPIDPAIDGRLDDELRDLD